MNCNDVFPSVTIVSPFGEKVCKTVIQVQFVEQLRYIFTVLLDPAWIWHTCIVQVRVPDGMIMIIVFATAW